MRNIQHLLFGLTFITTAALAGCNGGSGTGETVGSSEARFTLSNRGTAATSLQVTATDDTSSTVAIDQRVDVAAGATSMLDLGVAPASYTIQVQAFSDTDHTKLLGTGSAKADLAADSVTEINLTANTTGAKGGSVITLGVDAAPRIEKVGVTVSGSGATASAAIHVDAQDPDGGELTFFWSGLGIDGSLQGTSTLNVSAASASTSDGPLMVHVIVQDSGGATAQADVTFTGGTDCLVCGHADTSTSTADMGASAKACLDARSTCTASCDATFSLDPTDLTGQASCLSACGLTLASCMAQ
jgi:hypothetical protein